MMNYINLKQLPGLAEEERKFEEELDELTVEIVNKNVDGILEEGLDVIQAAIHVMLLNRYRLPMFPYKYSKLKIRDYKKEVIVTQLNRVGKRFISKRFYISFIAVVNNVLLTFKQFGISEEKLHAGIKKHNEKLKNRGWDLVPIGDKENE